MDTQRKVTCFVSRGFGADSKLCVFWHTISGVQVPAGTVEDGEGFEAGARREVFEETGLPDLELAGYLGSKTYELTNGWSVLRREVQLRVAPEAGAAVTHWKLGRNLNIGVVERKSGFARIVYAEEDLESPGGMVFARFEGWVLEDDLYARQERRFYHFRSGPGGPEKWQVIENGLHQLHLYWVPLTPKPVLISSNQTWLDEFYDAIVAGVPAT